MRELDTEIREAAFSVALVTIGSQTKADDFCARHNPYARCIGDADMRSYRSMGLGDYDLSRLQTDAALVQRRAENEAAGFRQDWDATRIDDAAQLPGAAAIDGNGALRFIYRGIHPGDLPPMHELLAQARFALTTT